MSTMRPNRDETVAFLRTVLAKPHGNAAVLNVIRCSKVRAAADFNLLAELVSQPRVKLDLARHGFDEARHAYVLLRRIDELGFRPFRLPPQLDRVEGLLDRSRARDVKQVYIERGAVSDAELMELAVAAFIVETDGLWRLELHRDALDDDDQTCAVLEDMITDERRHVAYLGRWLTWFEDRFSRRAVAAARARLDEASRQLDAGYYAALHDYFDRLAA